MGTLETITVSSLVPLYFLSTLISAGDIIVMVTLCGNLTQR
jgi:hypothetical protein